MTVKAALIMTAISIGLLVIYGADVAVGGGTGEGFLGPDHMARGLGLGLPSLILPIAAYFISRKESSKILGIMLIVSGILILIGGIVVITMQPTESQQTDNGRNPIAESVPLIAVGIFIVGLGVIKLKKS